MTLLPKNRPSDLLVKQSESVAKKQSSDLIPTLTTKAALDKILEIEKGLSIKNIIVDARPVCMQIQDHGEASVAVAIDLQLMRLAEAMNVKHNLSGGAIKTIVYDLIEKYPQETIEDFLFVFKRMRQGYYGEDYHLLNQASIFKCMQLHFEEKWTEHERIISKEKADRKKEESFTISDEALYKAYGIKKNDDGKLEYTDEPGTAVGPREVKNKEREKDEELQRFKTERVAKKIIHQNTVEGQKEILNRLYGDQTQSGTETVGRAGTDEAGTSHE